MKRWDLDGVTYVQPETAGEVSEEMLTLAEETFTDWFDTGEPVDWAEFIDRMLSYGYLSDGTRLEFDTYDSPAIRKIKRHVREYRNLG